MTLHFKLLIFSFVIFGTPLTCMERPLKKMRLHEPAAAQEEDPFVKPVERSLIKFSQKPEDMWDPNNHVTYCKTKKVLQDLVCLVDANAKDPKKINVHEYFEINLDSDRLSRYLGQAFSFNNNKIPNLQNAWGEIVPKIKFKEQWESVGQGKCHQRALAHFKLLNHHAPLRVDCIFRGGPYDISDDTTKKPIKDRIVSRVALVTEWLRLAVCDDILNTTQLPQDVATLISSYDNTAERSGYAYAAWYAKNPE